MNKPAKNLQTEAAPSTALTPIERAKVAINSTEHEKKLAELAKASVSITAITNTAGYEQCHAARMALKKVRIDIERIGKGAREDAQAFSKAVIAEQNRLIGIIEPEEARLETIQREWDDARRREKEAKEAAERQRKTVLEELVEEIRQRAFNATGASSDAIEEVIRALVEMPIDDSTFAELKQQAEGAKATTLIRLRAAHTKALAFEAEQKRLADERAENERIRLENEARVAAQRAQLAEEERLARETRDREATEARAAQELHASRMGDIHGIQQQVIIAQIGRLGVRKGGTIECIRETLAETEAWPITEGSYGPLTMVAQAAKDAAVKAIQELLAAAESNAARAAEAARQAEDLRRQREESDRIEGERQEARKAEEARLAAAQEEASRAEGERKALADAEEARIAEARAQLERDQAALKAEREKPAENVLPFSRELTMGEDLPDVSITVSGEQMPSVLETTGLLIAEEPADPLLMTIRLTEYLPMESVCKFAKVWAAFQDPDSKKDQKSDRKLAAQAREAAINLLVAVEALA